MSSVTTRNTKENGGVKAPDSMEFITPLIQLTVEALKLWNHEKATEFQDKAYNLLKRYDYEMAKGSLRDDALIYSIRTELCDLCNLYSTQLKGQVSKN